MYARGSCRSPSFGDCFVHLICLSDALYSTTGVISHMLLLAGLQGKLFVSAGLGGMSGAQPKGATICGAVALIAEVWRILACCRVAQRE